MNNNIPYYEWARYRGKFTITQLGAGSEVAQIGMQLTVNNGNLLLIDELKLLMSTQDAGVSVVSRILDSEASVEISRLLSSTLGSGQTSRLTEATINDDNTNLTAQIGSTKMPQALSESDILDIRTEAAIDADTTYTVFIRGFLRGDLPTITNVGTGITVTEDYNTVD